MGRLRQTLELAATVATIVVCAALTWSVTFARGLGMRVPTTRTAVNRRPPEPPAPTEPLSLDGAATRGSANAKAALVEFSDFQCPYCGAFVRDALPTLQQKYIDRGQLLIAFRQFPLEQIHKSALHAAEAAECAAKEGKFWEMHDRSFQHQQELDEVSAPPGLASLGLNNAAFSRCLSSGTGERLVRSDQALGRQLQVTGTPTFFLGTLQADGRVKVVRRFSGSPPTSQFSAMVDAVLGNTGSKPDAKTAR